MPRLVSDFREVAFDDEAVAVLLLFDEDFDLVQLATRYLSREVSDELYLRQMKLESHLRAAKEGRVDPCLPVSAIVPSEVLSSLRSAEAKALDGLYAWVLQNRPEEIERYWREKVPRSRTLVGVEENGVHVDMARLERALTSADTAPIDRSFLERVLSLLGEDGLVRTRFNLRPTRTGRIRVERGLACMSIPHGLCRSVFTSRFPGGKVVSFDFNAIDYRSIVKSIGGDFERLYEGATDFHIRTGELIGAGVLDSEGRRQLKHTSYIHFYGGKPETVSAKTGVSPSVVRDVLEQMDERLAPISQFRRELAECGRARGFVETPDGFRVSVSHGDSDGKILGLYAQSYSSRVFERAMTRVQENILRGRTSLVMFPVHDELNLDVSAWELESIVPAVRSELQAEGFVVKCKIGDDYDVTTE